MQFSIMKTAVAALAVCSDVVLGQASGPSIVKTLNTLTDLSGTLLQDATDINTVNFLISQGSKVLNDFKPIINTGSQALPELSQTPGPIAEEDAVADAYKSFATVHQNAMNVLIGASGVLQQLLGGPIAAALRSDEHLIDSISFAVIDLVPTHGAEIQKLATSLSQSVQKCIEAYSGTNLGHLGTLKRGSAAFRESLRM